MHPRVAVRRVVREDPRAAALAALLLAATLAYGLYCAAGVVGGWVPARGVDFKAYYLAGLRVRAGAPLYTTGVFDARVPDPHAWRYLYPPVVALAFLPFTLLPPTPAFVAWTACSVAVLLAGVAALVRGLGWSPPRIGWLLLAGGVLGFAPVVRALRIGNVTPLLAGTLCLAGGALAKGRGRRAAVLTALAALPKPFVAPAGAYLLRSRRRLVAGLAVAVGAALGGVFAFGPATTLAYLDVLAWGKGWSAGAAPGALPGKFRPLWRLGALAVPARLALLAGLAALAVATRRGGPAHTGHADGSGAAHRTDPRLFALGVVCVPLASPAANNLTLALAVPGLLVALLTEWHGPAGEPTGDGPASGDGTEGRTGRALVPLAALLVHANQDVLTLLRRDGPALVDGPWGVLRDAVLVQPATAGLSLVAGLLAWRLTAPFRARRTSAADEDGVGTGD